MLLLSLSLILAITAGLGRQLTVFGKFEKGLWLFSNWYWLRILLTSISIILAFVGYNYVQSNIGLVVVIIVVLLNAFSYFFEMPFFFPEVKQVKRIPATQVNISGDTKIIGVTVEPKSVAYPINEIVMPRHIVHDRIEETKVLISYCALCRSALAFKAEVDNQELYFKVAGVWRRNMIIIDSQSRSLWQQATGECIFGKHKGKQLELLSGENTSWESWEEKHPQSEYASQFTEARAGLMSREKMLAALKTVSSKVGVPGFTDLKGLPKRETVFGITIEGVSKAYPLSELKPGARFSDSVGEIELELFYDGKGEYLSASESSTKKSINVEKHWWLGWKEFHPNTKIWRNETRNDT
jgi:hypothetical protein